MIDNQDGIREKDIRCFSGKRHQSKDRLNKFKGDIHFEDFNDVDDNVEFDGDFND